MLFVVIGIDHETQWLDRTGDFKTLVTSLCTEHAFYLIAEEACTLPTTTAQRLAFRLDIPWIDMDMSHSQRKEAGFEDSVAFAPLFDQHGEYEGTRTSFPGGAQDKRENHWLSVLGKRGQARNFVICGSLHLDSICRKLSEKGNDVVRIPVWEERWYREKVGVCSIFEDEGSIVAETRKPPTANSEVEGG